MNSKRQEELFYEFSEEQRKILIKKRSDYATEEVLSNFIQTANITGTSPAQVALMLIGIKVARLGNLISNNKTNVNESMEDSVLDLANYAFLLKCILVDNNESALIEAGIIDEDDLTIDDAEILDNVDMVKLKKDMTNESIEKHLLDKAKNTSALKNVIQENNLWVECVNNDCNNDSLTIGKQYKVIKEDDYHYQIIDDLNEKESYFKWRFEEVTNNSNLKDWQKTKGRLDKR